MVDLEGIAKEIRKVKSLSHNQQTNMLTETINRIGIPYELELLLKDRFQRNLLMQDRNFAQLCDIPFTQIDKYWQAIIVGTAEYCRKKYGVG